MDKVYAVSDGEWDDWHIVNVFSTLEKAEEYRQWYFGNTDEKLRRDDVVVMNIDSFDISNYNNKTYEWVIEIKKRSGKKVDKVYAYPYDGDPTERVIDCDNVYHNCIAVICIAKTRDKAIKMAREEVKKFLEKENNDE